MLAKQLVFSKNRNFGIRFFLLSYSWRGGALPVGYFAVGFKHFSVSHMHCSHTILPSVCASLCKSSSLSFQPVVLFLVIGTHSIELRQSLAFL